MKARQREITGQQKLLQGYNRLKLCAENSSRASTGHDPNLTQRNTQKKEKYQLPLVYLIILLPPFHKRKKSTKVVLLKLMNKRKMGHTSRPSRRGREFYAYEVVHTSHKAHIRDIKLCTHQSKHESASCRLLSKQYTSTAVEVISKQS